MKCLSSSLARSMAALKNHLVATVLLAAFALASASASFPSSAMADEGDQTVTIYHFEMVYYDDPTFEDMGVPELTGMRLIGTSTVEDLKPGDVVRAWDHVGTHPGFRFFDGWPAEVTVSEDPAKNAIQLNYFRQSCDVTVNYYEISLLGSGAGLPLRGDTLIETIGDRSVEFTKLGSEVRPRELYAEVLVGDKLAESAGQRPESGAEPEVADDVDEMNYADREFAYVGSYPESVFVSMDSEKNEINLMYARLITGPDHVELESDAVALPDAVVLPDNVPIGDEAMTLPDDSSEGDKPTTEPEGGADGNMPGRDEGSNNGNSSEGAADNTVAAVEDSPRVTERPAAVEANRAETAAAAEDGILTLPQTDDERGLVFAMILVASGAAAVIATAAFRKILR